MSDLLRKLVAEAKVDPMVPPGCVEIHDSDGILLRRQVLPDARAGLRAGARVYVTNHRGGRRVRGEVRVASRHHKCEWCATMIRPGERYVDVNAFWRFGLCLSCAVPESEAA